MKTISVKDRLPEDRTYVLIHLHDRPWMDSNDNIGVFWKVAKFVRGLSKDERTVNSSFRSADEWGNNLVPYCWVGFGPDSYFGQEVDYWCELPDLT